MASARRSRSSDDPAERAVAGGGAAEGAIPALAPLRPEGTQPMSEPVRMMRAMCASSPDPASLSSQSVPVPDPGPGEVLVEVRATAVTTGELEWPESWPAIPCHDLSGVVAATGPRVADWQPGDNVYGLVG